MKISRALSNERLMKGVTGMSVNEFQKLTESFKQNLEKEKLTHYEKELKKEKRGRKP